MISKRTAIKNRIKEIINGLTSGMNLTNNGPKPMKMLPINNIIMKIFMIIHLRKVQINME